MSGFDTRRFDASRQPPRETLVRMTAREYLHMNYVFMDFPADHFDQLSLQGLQTVFETLGLSNTPVRDFLWHFESVGRVVSDRFGQTEGGYSATIFLIWFRSEIFRLHSTLREEPEEASQGAPAGQGAQRANTEPPPAGQGAPPLNTVQRTEQAMLMAAEQIRRTQELLASRGGAAQAAAPQAAAQQAAAQQAARPQSRDECQLCSDQLTPENALYLPDGTCPHPLACKSCAPTVLRNLEDANLDLRNEKVHMKCSYCRSSFWIQSFKDGSPNGTRAIDVWNSYEPRAEDRLPQRPRQEQPRTVGNSNEAQLHLRTNYFSHLQYHRQVEALDPYKNLTLDEAEESINADLQQEDPTAAWSGLDDASRARLMDAVIQKRRGDTAVIFVNRRRNRVVRWPNDVMDLTQDVLNVDP